MALSDLKYVTDGAWGTGVDRVLSANEIDTNTFTLASAIQYLIDHPVAGKSMVDVTVVGRQMTIIMSDASTIGPIELPVAVLNPTGEWAPSTAYYAMDVVTVTGDGTYLVIRDHTSDTTFDPEASDTGGPLYYLLGGSSGSGGGFTNFSFTDTAVTLDESSKNTYREYRGSDPTVVTITGAAGFSEGDEVIFFQAGDGPISITQGTHTSIRCPNGYKPATQIPGQSFKLRYVETGDDALWDLLPIGLSAREYVLDVSGDGLVLESHNDGDFYNSTSDTEFPVVLPADFADSGKITVRQGGAGVVSITGDIGATLSYKTSKSPATAELGDVIICKYRGGGVWMLYGDLAPAP